MPPQVMVSKQSMETMERLESDVSFPSSNSSIVSVVSSPFNAFNVVTHSVKNNATGSEASSNWNVYVTMPPVCV